MKGSLYVWFVVLAVIFVTGLIWTLMSQVYLINFFPVTETLLTDHNLTDAQSTLSTIEMIWNYWPLILIIGMLLWAFVSVQKKEPDTYYG